MKLKIFISIISIVTLGSIIYIEQNSSPLSNSVSSSQSNNKHIKLPNFKYYDIVHNTNSSLYNQVKSTHSSDTIIHFWASWCNVCRSEFADIVQYSKQHPEKTILTVSIDDEPDALKSLIEEFNQKYQVNNISNLIFAWDKNKAISQDIFDTYMVPENYVLNSKFQVVKKITGKSDWVKL